MTAKRFRSGLAKNDEFSDEIIDELTGKHYFDSTKDDYVFSEEIVDLLNKLNDKCEFLEIENESLEDGATKYAKLYHESLKENERLKKQIEYQEEGIVDAIDSLMELPSATIYLLKQWIDALEEYDSMEDMKNTFSERIKELEECQAYMQ